MTLEMIAFWLIIGMSVIMIVCTPYRI